MPACLWAQEHEIEFVKRHLGPALRKAGMPTKIWVLDHNYNLWGRAIDELSDPAAYEYIDGIAWHGYVGEPSAMTPRSRRIPAQECLLDRRRSGHQAARLPDRLTPSGPTPSTASSTTGRAPSRRGISRSTKRASPTSGHSPAAASSRSKTSTHKITRSGQYWAFAHYTRHIKRGAKVFASNGLGYDGAGGPVSHAGFRNPDGSYVVVLANTGPEKRVQLVLGAQALEVEVPADSVHTFSGHDAFPSRIDGIALPRLHWLYLSSFAPLRYGFPLLCLREKATRPRAAIRNLASRCT